MASIPVASHSASKVHEHVIQQRHKPEEKERLDPKFNNPFHNSVFGWSENLYNQIGFLSEAMGNITPPNYNSKLMNSIWGMYNLYAAHAFQKNNEGSPNAYYHFSVPQAKMTFSLWDLLRSRF